MVQIYSSFKSNRLIYVLDYLFKERLLLDYQLVEYQELIDSKASIKINYSHEIIQGCWQIIPSTLLKQEEIDPSFRVMSPNFNEPLAFPNTRVDLLAFIFFYLSRYEEYQSSERDAHGRFQAKSSTLFSTTGFHSYRFPVVDMLVVKIKSVLKEHFDDAVVHSETRSIATIDVDAFYAYKGRNLFRQLGAFAKDLTKLRFGETIKRCLVLSGLKHDPNDNFEYQMQVLKANGLKANYFIQTGPYGPFDKNIRPDHPEVIRMLGKIRDDGHEIGIHPSYQSDSDPVKIKNEMTLLENSTGVKIKHSRQHFLRLRLPDTYRALIECGIEHDWSMGFSEDYGFRAGTAMPFKWFDLLENYSTKLTIHPFCAMDVTFKEHLKMSPEKCLEETLKIKHWLNEQHLPFTFIFHNESLSEHRGWNGWRIVFEKWQSES